MFSVGDIFSKNYQAINFKRYFLVLDEPSVINELHFYLVLEIGEGTIASFGVDHRAQSVYYPIQLEV